MQREKWAGAKDKSPQGKTALVTGAAGAVGSLAVQLLVGMGMKVVACAGTREKCELVTSLGASACWNYRSEEDPVAALNRHAPDGIDLFFDNVGGAILDAALKHMNKEGIILACGAISGYDTASAPLHNWFYVTINRLRIHGFIASDFIADGKAAEAMSTLATMVSQGDLMAKETLVVGKFQDGVLPKVVFMILLQRLIAKTLTPPLSCHINRPFVAYSEAITLGK